MFRCSRVHTLFLRLAAAGLLLALAACSVDTPVPPTPAPTAVPTADPLLGLGEAAEAWNLLGQLSGAAWPGWGKPLPPLLISKGEDDFLLGHPNPPEGFAPAAGLTFNGQPIMRRSGHLLPVPAATAWNVGGVWSVAVPDRLEFQQAVDQALGKGKVTIDPPAYVRAIVHEAFHAYQMTVTGGKPPNFGADVDEQKLLQDLSTRSGLGDRYSAEGQALANALRATTQVDILQETARFLQLRRERRASLSAEVAAYEQSVEWVEGLARYVDTTLIRLAGQPGYSSSLPSLTYPGPSVTFEQFLKDLADPTRSPDGFRGRYYLLGAGQAFLLDRLSPGWKDVLLKDRLSLEALLTQALK